MFGYFTLTCETVLQYLLHRGELRLEDLFDGDFECTMSQGRNTVFRIEVGKHQAVFIKQCVAALDDASPIPFQIESSCYSVFSGSHPNSALERIAPRRLFVDIPNRIIAVELLRNGDWCPPASSLSGSSLHFVSRLASSISSWHSVRDSSDVDSSPLASLPTRMPWILYTPNAAENGYQPKATAAKTILDFIQNSATIRIAFHGILRTRRPTCPIHGDLKFANILYAAGERITETTLPVIVDWEMACVGDPLWDLACVIECIFRSIALDRDHLMSLSSLAAFCAELERTHALATAGCFLKSYVQVNTWLSPAVLDSVDDLVRYIGARMLQWTIEASSAGSDVIAEVALYSTLAASLLETPVQLAANIKRAIANV